MQPEILTKIDICISSKEMVVMKKIVGNKVAKFLSRASAAVAKSNANQTCALFMHQEKLPDKVKNLRKF